MTARLKMLGIIHGLILLVLMLGFGRTARSDDGGPGVQSITLSTCYVPVTPVLETALDGDTEFTIGDDSQTDSETDSICGDSYPCTIDCGSGTYWGQTLDFYYKVRETDELIITPTTGNPLVQQITKESAASQSYGQQFNAGHCQSREDFAAEALAYFNHYYENELKPQLCQ